MRVGIPRTKDLGKYFIFPFIHHRNNKATYWELIDRFNERLAVWKASGLNLAGRITLAKTVLNSTPIPMAFTQKLEKHTWLFVWGGDEERRWMHLLSWANLCKPKQVGELTFDGHRKWILLLCESSPWGSYMNLMQLGFFSLRSSMLIIEALLRYPIEEEFIQYLERDCPQLSHYLTRLAISGTKRRISFVLEGYVGSPSLACFPIAIIAFGDESEDGWLLNGGRRLELDGTGGPALGNYIASFGGDRHQPRKRRWRQYGLDGN